MAETRKPITAEKLTEALTEVGVVDDPLANLTPPPRYVVTMIEAMSARLYDVQLEVGQALKRMEAMYRDTSEVIEDMRDKL